MRRSMGVERASDHGTIQRAADFHAPCRAWRSESSLSGGERSVPSPHSALSASAGSSLRPRMTGTEAAATATPRTVTAVSRCVAGSSGLNP